MRVFEVHAVPRYGFFLLQLILSHYVVGLLCRIVLRSPCCIVAAVGDGMSNTTGVSGRFFSALGSASVNVLAIAQVFTSTLALSYPGTVYCSAIEANACVLSRTEALWKSSLPRGGVFESPQDVLYCHINHGIGGPCSICAPMCVLLAFFFCRLHVVHWYLWVVTNRLLFTDTCCTPPTCLRICALYLIATVDRCAMIGGLRKQELLI